MTRTLEDARRRYLPDGPIDVLFIAEAPPADRSRFFYFDQVDRHDWLYLALMRALFADTRDLDVKQLRRQKPDYLLRFRERGYYLIDASDDPMPARATPSQKRAQLRDSLDALIAKTRKLAIPSTRIVLISKSVHEVCCTPLRAASVNVVNQEMIDFPACGRQRHFAEKLRRDVQESDALLQSAIRGLEATVRFFGAGKAQQKERDRWVVEHFLRCLGIVFQPNDIEQPEHDPPDARFRGAELEVKEIQEHERRRGDEYKKWLAKARAAIRFADLSETFSPQSISIRLVYQKIMEQTQKLATEKYRTESLRSSLDLLFYVNLGMAKAWDIEDGERPDIGDLVKQGWRSVSFLHGARTACVIFASNLAPRFLKSVEGRLLVGDPNE